MDDERMNTSGTGGGGAAAVSTICQSTSSVIINIPPSSPRSPRLAHLRPPSPLTPEAMRRINLLTVQEGPIDASKLSPISPLYPTSDLGSSPRSSISVTTSSSSSAWSAYRDHKKSSSDFTDADSDCCKDLFSPSIMLSPAPFSPFSDHPDMIETPAFSDPTSTPMGQRLRFTFDPKSPSFLQLPPSRSSHFLLPPAPALGVLRERSRSDSDTTTALDSSNDESSPGSVEPTPTSGNSGMAASGTLSVASKSGTRRQVEGHKHLYKKRLLRKYNEETNADAVSASLASANVTDNLSSSGSTLATTAANMTTVTVTSADDEASAPKNGRPAIVTETNASARFATIMRQDPLSCVTSLSISQLAAISCLSAPVSPTCFRPSSSLGLSTSASSSQIGSIIPNANISKSASAQSMTAMAANSNPNSNLNAAQRSIESANLPLLRIGAAGLSNQSYFDLWLKQQLLAVNSLWYPPDQHAATSNVAATSPVGIPGASILGNFSSAATIQQQIPTKQPSPNAMAPDVKSGNFTPVVAMDSAVSRRPIHHSTAPTSTSAVGPMKSRRSRSESDVSYVCQHCGQSFSLHDRLAKHVASRHRDRSTSSESPLKSHKCTVCHKAFGRSDMLTRHMRLHTGIKPYACRICGQVFSRSDHLSTHHRTHTGEKPYQCPQCPYAASRRDMITRHMRTHSRSNFGDHSSSSPSSTSSSGGAAGHVAYEESSTSANVGYVSVIRKALDHTLIIDPAPNDSNMPGGGGGDFEESSSQLATPRMSADSSGRASTGSVSTVLCAEEEEDMMCQLTEESEQDEREVSMESSSPVFKSSMDAAVSSHLIAHDAPRSPSMNEPSSSVSSSFSMHNSNESEAIQK